MKRHNLLFVFIVAAAVLTSVHANEQEEVDFLLFMPNSSSEFVNERQAGIQLDYLAQYLKSKNPDQGQIIVYGYAANAVNDIEPVILSKDRAIFVINELQKRGIGRNLFSDPVGHGAVDLWGANTNEVDRIPNRRVRILLGGEILTPVVVKAAEPVVVAPVAAVESPAKPAKESDFKFPWWILFVLLLLGLPAALFYLLSKRKYESKLVPKPVEKPVAPAAAVPVVTRVKVVNLEEEIRFRAYEMSLERYGQNGDMDGDWYTALPEVCARYETEGYEVYTESGIWWARKSFTEKAQV